MYEVCAEDRWPHGYGGRETGYADSTPSIPGSSYYNDWTYPSFIALMDELGVSSKPTAMGFSVRDPESGLEYSGTNLDTLFAQRRNLGVICRFSA